jgi:hypothetical protein
MHSSSDLPFLEHLSCVASTNPDIINFVAMLNDPDQSCFEQDMIREVSDLLHSGTVEITPRSSVKNNLTPLPSIWSF